MKGLIDKILDRLEEEQENEDFHDFQMNEGFEIGIDAAKEIVQEVSEEYNGGWIPCSACKDCKNKECEHNGKV